MFYLVLLPIIISFLSSIAVYIRRPNPLYLQFFPAFLFISILVQIIGPWLAMKTGNNAPLLNFYSILNFCFYLFVLKDVIVSRLVKQGIKIIIIAFLIWSLYNVFFIQKVDMWNSMTYSTGCLLVVALSIYYFFELFKRPAFIDLKKEPSFWIISGIMFFCACSFPFLGLANFLLNAPLVLINNLSTILTLLSVLMYALFTIAFICRLRFRKPV